MAVFVLLRQRFAKGNILSILKKTTFSNKSHMRIPQILVERIKMGIFVELYN